MQNSFIKAIEETFIKYDAHGARSNKKLIPLHSWFAMTMKEKLGDSYLVEGLAHGGEQSLDGKYYPKTLDISIKKDNKIITTISLKFVMCNYKQNSNNYFENLLGETSNIKRVGVGFAHFFVLRSKTPYRDKNKGNLHGKTKKYEEITRKYLLKYLKLHADLDFPHKPDVLGIALIDEDKGIKLADLQALGFQNDEKDIFNIQKFIEKTVALATLKC